MLPSYRASLLTISGQSAGSVISVKSPMFCSNALGIPIMFMDITSPNTFSASPWKLSGLNSRVKCQ